MDVETKASIDRKVFHDEVILKKGGVQQGNGGIKTLYVYLRIIQTVQVLYGS